MVLQGQNDQAIALLGELLATRPARDIEMAALIHMATALENRGSPQALRMPLNPTTAFWNSQKAARSSPW